MSAVTTVRGPADMLAVLPYMTGYHLDSSLVCVCVQDNRLGMIARVDLPLTAAERRDAANIVVPPVLEQSPSSVVVIGYGTDEATAKTAVRSLAVDLAREGVQIDVELSVVGDHYRMLCDCCDNRPRPLPTSDHPAALNSRVFGGWEPAPSRQTLAEQVAAGPQAAVVGPVCAALPTVSIDHGVTAWASILTGEQPVADLPPVVLAQAAVVLAQGHAFRDALVMRLCPGMSPDETVPETISEAMDAIDATLDPRRATDRLQALCRCLPDRYAVPVLCLLASLCWATGRGAQSREAVDRALTANPTYPLAILIEQLLDLAVPPPAVN